MSSLPSSSLLSCMFHKSALIVKFGPIVLCFKIRAWIHSSSLGQIHLASKDFILPQNLTSVDGNFFTFTAMRPLITAPAPSKFTVTKAAMAEFPALNGQSVSYAVLQFPANSVNPPHTHPRASELLFVTYGSLEVGFADTTNKLYTQTLQAGDIFVFPKGLVHFQFCNGEGAAAISAFGSASAGTVSVPATVFGSGIDDDVLALAFKTDVATVQKIKAGLATKA